MASYLLNKVTDWNIMIINLYEGGESPSAAVGHHVPVQATQAIQGRLIPELLKTEIIEWYTDDNSKQNLGVGLKI